MDNKEWDKRFEESITLRESVWLTGIFVQHDTYVRKFLEMWKGKKVLDVACGWGRFADMFEPENYLGIDFSQKMIEKARQKYPNHKFKCKTFEDINDEPYDLVFEVISLGPMGLSEAEFEGKFRNAKAIAMFQADYFKVKFNFNTIDSVREREMWDKRYENN